MKFDLFKMDEFYEHMWEVHHEGPFAVLDESLQPRPSAVVMYEIANQAGLGSTANVLDIGCGRGNHTCALVQRFGCCAVGLDPVAANLDMAQKTVSDLGLTGLITFQPGFIEALPFDSAMFDFIWCRDVLVHVAKLKQGLSECARVLKPNGSMLVYTTFATDFMGAQETTQIYEPLGIVAENLALEYFEQLCKLTGFHIIAKQIIASEMMEYLEEREKQCSKELMRVARLLRQKERFLAELGETRYKIALAVYQWSIYQLLGKLCPVIYALGKEK